MTSLVSHRTEQRKDSHGFIATTRSKRSREFLLPNTTQHGMGRLASGSISLNAAPGKHCGSQKQF